MKSKNTPQIVTLEDTELATVDVNSLQKHDSSVADKLTVSGYLPRLQFMSSNSKECKEGNFNINHFALASGQTLTDLGLEIDILPLIWRPKALDMSGEENITVYDSESTEFQRIETIVESKIKDSKCMYGLEFLVWVPEVSKFATFFMGTITTRREAPNLVALLGNPTTLKGAKIETSKYTYFSPCVTKCSTPTTQPPTEDLIEQAEKFNNPKVVEVKRVEEEPADNSGRAM